MEQPKQMSPQLKHYYNNRERVLGYYKNYYELNADKIKAKRRERYKNSKIVKEVVVEPVVE